jgi:N-carbamoyl-L-amino-acid hydrolase
MLEKIINALDLSRLVERHNILAGCTTESSSGVNRQALSLQDVNARKLLIQWAKNIGMQVFTDAASNLFLRLEGKFSDLPPVVAGSHIDSQPTGGKYDGVFGVLSALEIAESFYQNHFTPDHSFEVVCWMNEEGSRFAPGMMGSSVFAGSKSLQEILNVVDDEGVSVDMGIKYVHSALPSLPLRDFGFPIKCYFEPHIEQAPFLERADVIIGAVTGMQGKKTFTVTIKGRADHVGTVPLSERNDALLCATKIMYHLYEKINDDDDVKFTIGKIIVAPNAPSVVPSNVLFTIDLRHPCQSKLDKYESFINSTIKKFNTQKMINLNSLVDDKVVQFPSKFVSAVFTAAEELGVSCTRILSLAGHDSKFIHKITPTGMIFIPCKGGISHNPAEEVHPPHLLDGARVLCHVLYHQLQLTI